MLGNISPLRGADFSPMFEAMRLRQQNNQFNAQQQAVANSLDFQRDQSDLERTMRMALAEAANEAAMQQTMFQQQAITDRLGVTNDFQQKSQQAAHQHQAGLARMDDALARDQMAGVQGRFDTERKDRMAAQLRREKEAADAKAEKDARTTAAKAEDDAITSAIIEARKASDPEWARAYDTAQAKGYDAEASAAYAEEISKGLKAQAKPAQADKPRELKVPSPKEAQAIQAVIDRDPEAQRLSRNYYEALNQANQPGAPGWMAENAQGWLAEYEKRVTQLAAELGYAL